MKIVRGWKLGCGKKEKSINSNKRPSKEERPNNGRNKRGIGQGSGARLEEAAARLVTTSGSIRKEAEKECEPWKGKQGKVSQISITAGSERSIIWCAWTG